MGGPVKAALAVLAAAVVVVVGAVAGMGVLAQLAAAGGHHHAGALRAAPAAVGLGGLPGPAVPYPGGPTGCVVPDPTGTGGCVTGATAWLVAETEAAFGPWPWAASCWDPHEWNPESSHPEGGACDYAAGTIGAFPDAEQVRAGWLLAEWWRANAEALRISYVIWQGMVWNRGDAGWRPYSGGSVYDVSSPSGGHWDHAHADVGD